MVCNNDSASLTFKDKGNNAYKQANWPEAIQFYSEGLHAANDVNEKGVLLKNRAAAFLKSKDYDSAINDCTEALGLISLDPKALFRRAQAYEALGNYEKSYADARLAQTADPKNKEIQALLSRQHALVQDKIEQRSKLDGKVEHTFNIVFDPSVEVEKRCTASANLVALAKENAGSKMLLENNILSKVIDLLKTEKTPEIRINCCRLLAELCKNVKLAKDILATCGCPFFQNLMNSSNENIVTSAQYMIQKFLDILSISDLKGSKKTDKKLIEENTKEIDSIMYALTSSITTRSISGYTRDAIIELLTKNLGGDALDWCKKFLKIEGVHKLLEVASELQEYHYESCIGITEKSRMITAICLDRIYQNQFDDKTKTAFINMVDEFIKEHLIKPDVEHRVRATVAITTLLMGPVDVGNTFIGREGILEMLLTMANSGEELQQKVSCEALICAATKKDKCQSILTQGTNILKELYQSKNDAIKVRALVGLCKIGSLGGSDASLKPFSEGAANKLYEACRRFLVNPSKDKDMRRWACEGLSYLTLDAEVKEKLAEDTNGLQSIIELAKEGDLNCVYGVVTTLVNLCNAYDKQEIVPEMLELAKFAKQHIPEEHELDDKDFVDKRLLLLCEVGVVSALVALSKTESQNSRELISRIFNAICEQEKNRGKVVQQGGTKALLDLAHEGTPKGKKCAAQALARVAITINPEVSFSGQRAYEVVRPLLKLLDLDCSALENFEGLMGLCNIAGISESTRQRIIKEKGLSSIEHYMFEDHELIRRAAFQCMTNMCSSPDVVKILEGKNDKLKYLFLCSADEDIEIVKAASGALCMVFPESNECCKKVFEIESWAETLQYLISHQNPEVQYRGAVITYCLVQSNKENAQKIIETHSKEALMALSKIENPEFVHPKAREFACKIIDCWVSLNLMDPIDEAY